MTDPVTTNKVFPQPTRNSDVGTWDVPVNLTTTYLDALMGSLDTLSLSSTNVALTIGTESNYLGYILTGTLLQDITISFPPIGGIFIISNQTTGAYTVTINTSAVGSTGVLVEQGDTQLIYLDGTNGHPAAPAVNLFPSGTTLLFYQAAAPTGWTQNTSYNDYALRIVSGTGAGVHGSVGLSAFISGGTQETTLSIAQIPSGLYSLNDPGHNHTTGLTGGDAFAFAGGPDVYCPQGNPLTSGTGFSKTGITMTDNAGGGAHNHGLQDLQYLDCLLATKN